jgi:hypothetical protein
MFKFILLACLLGTVLTFNIKTACDESKANHGCSPFCGYDAVKAGEDFICLPSKSRTPFPFEVSTMDEDELCQMVAANNGCCETCGFTWDSHAGGCVQAEAVKQAVEKLATGSSADPIIGGSGKFRYQYMPDLLKVPTGGVLGNCHGLVTDKDKNIILTYQPGSGDTHCLIRWNPDGTSGTFVNDTVGLCTGVPHGLKITTEGDQQFLYHANNAQKLAKTTLDGEIVWIVEGMFGQNETCGPNTCPAGSCKCPGGKAPYIPTWFATPPNSKYMYLCDGYGSDRVFAFERATGKYMNKSWGGRSPGGLHPGSAGPTQPHGLFMENHGCTYDPRSTAEPNTIVVSDRRNQRFELFHYNPDGYDKFEWYKTIDMSPSLGPGTLPCNMRM